MLQEIVSVAILIGSATLLTACCTAPVQPPEHSRDPLAAAYEGGDYASAARLLRVKAEAGEPQAQYALGYLYYYGRGVQRNYQRAIDLIDLSAAQGYPRAVEAMRLLRTQFQQRHQQAAQAATGKAPEMTPKPEEGQSAATEPLRSTVILSARQPQEQKRPKAPRPEVEAKPAAVAPPVSLPAASARKARYTLQLIGASREERVVRFIARNKLDGQANYIRTQHNGAPWYVVIYGRYATVREARRALRQLPPELHKGWIRPLHELKASLAHPRSPSA